MAHIRIHTFFALFWVATSVLAAHAAPSRASSAPTLFNSHNVYLAGGHTRPTAPVEGDLMAVGGKVVVDQGVKGDAALAGGSIEVRAPIGDDLRAVGGDVAISSAIGGELFATGGNVTLSSTAQVANGARCFGGTVTLDGKIDGPLEVEAQKIILNGTVTGDADLRAHDIEHGPSARIGGALNYTSTTGDLRRAPGAIVTGAITRDDSFVGRGDGIPDRRWQRQMNLSGPVWMAWVLPFFGILAFSAILVLVFPTFATRAADTFGMSPWLALAVGFGVFAGLPAFAGLLFISLLGIPLGVVVLALFPAVLLLGFVVGTLFVSRRISLALHQEQSTSFAVTMGFLALALLAVLLLGRLPFVGTLSLAFITLVGLGASVLALPRPHPTQPTTPRASNTMGVQSN
jgi:hypothetical protein